MKRYVEGQDRSQATLFPESLDEYIAEDNPVRVVEVFVDELDLKDLGVEGAEPEATVAMIPGALGESTFHTAWVRSGHRPVIGPGANVQSK